MRTPTCIETTQIWRQLVCSVQCAIVTVGLFDLTAVNPAIIPAITPAITIVIIINIMTWERENF